MKKRIQIILGSVLAMIILIISSLFVKWPQETRYGIRMLPYAFVFKPDARRVHGLQELKKEVLDYARRTGTLPDSIDQLGFNNIADPTIIKDPKTKQPYAYHALSQAQQQSIDEKYRPDFELCATFQGPSPIFLKDVTPPCKGTCLLSLMFRRINPLEPENTDFEFWDHGIGSSCWTFDVHGNPISGSNVTPL